MKKRIQSIFVITIIILLSIIIFQFFELRKKTERYLILESAICENEKLYFQFDHTQILLSSNAQFKNDTLDF